MSDDKVKDDVKEVKKTKSAPAKAETKTAKAEQKPIKEPVKAGEKESKKKDSICDKCPKTYGSGFCYSCVEYKHRS